MPRGLLLVTLIAVVVAGLLVSPSLGPGHRTTADAPRWSTDALNALVNSMIESAVETRGSLLRIEGVAASGPAWRSALAQLRSTVADDVDLIVDVYVVDEGLSVQELCRRMFAELSGDNVMFRQSAAEIRSESYAVLDRITGFTRDCPAEIIAITGHTDSTGAESNNRLLSHARAQAVADYLVAAGVSADRLEVRGAGSSRPLADDATPYGRAQNRRIEFSLVEKTAANEAP